MTRGDYVEAGVVVGADGLELLYRDVGPGRRPRLMRNSIRCYDWGSRQVLAKMQGRPVPGQREAELWMGAHGLAPSFLLDDDGGEVGLPEAIAQDPDGTLGPDCLARFGPRLPFLLKVLAVERTLSVQVHPAAEQAAAGFAGQAADGIGRHNPQHVYADPQAKPELVCAVTPFQALAGLRASREAAYLLGLLDAPRLDPLLRMLGSGSGTEAALELVMSWPVGDRRALVQEAAAGARALLAAGPAGAAQAAGANPSPEVVAAGWVDRLARQHHADPLVLAPMLLRLHQLAPGAALFVPPGVVHCYLRGVAVEVAGASDNVVRAGLTAKHVDRDAFAHLLDPQAQPVEVVTVELTDREVGYHPPTAELRLSRVDVDAPVMLSDDGPPGPQILLCLHGSVDVSTGEHHVRLTGGQSAFLGADAAPAVLSGDGQVYRARPGR